MLSAGRACFMRCSTLGRRGLTVKSDAAIGTVIGMIVIETETTVTVADGMRLRVLGQC